MVGTPIDTLEASGEEAAATPRPPYAIQEAVEVETDSRSCAKGPNDPVVHGLGKSMESGEGSS